MTSKLRDVVTTLENVPAMLKLAAAIKPRPSDTRDGLALRFEETVSRFGQRPAIIFEGQTVTWDQLNRQANRYARALKGLGLQRGDVAALMMENRVQMAALILAMAKLGVTSALLNTNLSGRALSHCLSVTGSGAVIFGEERCEVISELRAQLAAEVGDKLYYIADGGELDVPAWAQDLDALALDEEDGNLPDSAEATIGDTVFYIFTSGTTGLPKAAVVSSRRLLIAAGMAHLVGLRCDERDRIYVCLPLYHGTGLWMGFCAACQSGAAVVLRRKFSASQFLPEVREHGVTCLIYIGELCRYLMNTAEQPGEADTTLRTMLGNGLRPDIWKAFKARFGIERVCEFYGASEGNVAFVNFFNKDCTVGTTTLKVALVKYDVDNDEIVRDERGRCIEANPGEPGLLLGKITEQTEFEGYTNPEATEQKILRNALEEGDAWFNTGDLMKTVDVGFALGMKHYQFVDRVGDTFRWKSENVSTSEVGEVLCSHPQVAFCNVYGVEVPGADGRAGMAALVVREGEKLDLESLAAHVNAALPAYARPVFLRLLPQMDTTGTFKMIKGDLRREAYDPARVSDPLFVMLPGASAYTPLDVATAGKILAGDGGF